MLTPLICKLEAFGPLPYRDERAAGGHTGGNAEAGTGNAADGAGHAGG